MLRPIDPAKHIEEVGDQRKKFEAIALAPFVVAMLFLTEEGGGWRHDVLSFALLLFSNLASAVLTNLLLPMLTIWVGKLPFVDGVEALQQPASRPDLASAYADASWNNRIVLGAFYIVFRVVCAVAIFLPLDRLLASMGVA